VRRRRFLVGLGTAGAFGAFGSWLAAFGAGDAGAQTPPGGSGGKPPATPAPGTPPAPTPEARAEADAWLAIVRARVGEHLKAADEPALREELLNAVPGSKALRARTLPNGLDPDTVFRARELES
jgi:hypothetical protein